VVDIRGIPLYNNQVKVYISDILTRVSPARTIRYEAIGTRSKKGDIRVKKIIIAINGLLLLCGLLVFTSLTPSTASASVLPQNDSKMTMSSKHHNKRRHHRRWRKHHRSHHGNSNSHK
jgi:hypothetical protein